MATEYMPDRTHVRSVLDTYIRAWEGQDADLITTIFTEKATYHERVLDKPIPDRRAIHRYWKEKVQQAQANIKVSLLNFYVDGSTVIAEWEAEFDDLAKHERKRMREVAILDFAADGRISALREYWASEVVGPLSGAEAS